MVIIKFKRLNLIMVKGYDPSADDPSKIVLEYLLRWSTTPNPLSLEEALKYTKHWLKHSQSTSQIYNKFSTLTPDKQPQIILKKSCSKLLNWSYWKILMPQEISSDEHYPAYTEKNKLIVCLNQITNKTQLKQNIDRQLTILLKKQQKHSPKPQVSKKKNQSKNLPVQPIETQLQERDKQLMQFIYEGCKQGYKNYMLDKEVEERISKKCAKYLFFRRSQRQLPYDAKFRYSSKILDELI